MRTIFLGGPEHLRVYEIPGFSTEWHVHIPEDRSAFMFRADLLPSMDPPRTGRYLRTRPVDLSYDHYWYGYALVAHATPFVWENDLYDQP